MKKPFYRSKTFWLGIATLLSSVTAVQLRLFVKDPTLAEKTMAVLGLLIIAARTLGGQLTTKKEQE